MHLIYSGAPQTRFYHGSKQYEPRSDCFLMEQSDLDPYCLQYRLPKNISRQEEQATKVVTAELGLKAVKEEHLKDIVNFQRNEII